jgi:hypothetical protein
MKAPVSVSDIFKTMFSQPSPWVASDQYYEPKQVVENAALKTNPISQM